MTRRSLNLALALIVLLASLSAWADKAKDEETLRNAETVMKAMVASKSVPLEVLAKAECVIVLPGVKKFGFGVGGSGGRGPMLCRTENRKAWSAPAMYTIGGVSAGMQIGGSSTDYVILVMTKKGLDALLKSKTKLGHEATAAAGPSGATKSSTIGSDMLTYSRAKGLFAGTSLGGSTLEVDKEANKRIYDRDISAEEIVVKNTVETPAAAQPLNALLNLAKPAETPKSSAKNETAKVPAKKK